jgi:homoserine dehydrogenase
MDMHETLGIALIGCGTVGGGVADILLHHKDRLAARAGRPLALRRVVVRDPNKPRDVAIPKELISTEHSPAILDPAVHVVVELIGGTTTAKKIVLDALAAGKHVVTANKALLADAGHEVFEAARKAERAVCFEAAVAGGVPIIRALGESLAANQVTAIQAILNGTSNFILSAMAERGMTYAAALAEAQKLGYAEADPTLDVDGSDAAHKLAILAQIAFGVAARPHEIERKGIDTLDAVDIRFANELGYTIKLLAEAWTSGTESEPGRLADKQARRQDTEWDSARSFGSQVALHVAPVLLRHTDLLAQVRGAYNAILVHGDIVGETLYQGPGAGRGPTASSVVADLIDLAVGRAQRSFAAAQLWSKVSKGFTVEPPERVRSRFYLRLLVADKPGVLADVTRILADEHISISSVVQHEAPESEPGVPTPGLPPVPLVIVTHYAETGRFKAALRKINALSTVAAPAVFFSMGD